MMDETEMMFDSNNENSSMLNYGNNATNNKLNLKQQVMINQFMSITGLTFEQSLHLLASTNWQYQIALSLFFDEFSLATIQSSSQLPHLPPITTNKPLAQSKSNSNSSNSLVSINNLSLCAPSNTPVTPPNLEYLEKAFQKLSANTNNSNQSASNNVNIMMNSNSNLNLKTTTSGSSLTSSSSANTAIYHGQKSMPVPINSTPIFYINNNMNYNN